MGVLAKSTGSDADVDADPPRGHVILNERQRVKDPPRVGNTDSSR